MTIVNYGVTYTAHIVYGRVHLSIMSRSEVIVMLNLCVLGRHHLSDFETYSANLNQISLLQSLAGHIHLWTLLLTNYLPYFLFWFLLQHIVQVLVNRVLMVDPITSILVVRPGNDLISQKLVHLLLLLFKDAILVLNTLNVYLIFISVDPMRSLDFELFPNDVLTLKVKQTMGLSRPCHCFSCQYTVLR